jgi:hypothetical protein
MTHNVVTQSIWAEAETPHAPVLVASEAHIMGAVGQHNFVVHLQANPTLFFPLDIDIR